MKQIALATFFICIGLNACASFDVVQTASSAPLHTENPRRDSFGPIHLCGKDLYSRAWGSSNLRLLNDRIEAVEIFANGLRENSLHSIFIYEDGQYRWSGSFRTNNAGSYGPERISYTFVSTPLTTKTVTVVIYLHPTGSLIFDPAIVQRVMESSRSLCFSH